MKKHTVKTKAYVTQYSSITPKDIQEGNRVDELCFGSWKNPPDGWTCVGDAEITFTPVDNKTLVDNKVQALRSEAASIRAEAAAKVTRIETQIQNLLAISYDEATA